MGLWDSQNGGGGTGGIADGVQTLAVANFAALPSAASHTDEIYYVQNSTGIYLINRKNKGFYKSDGVNWNPWEQDDLAMDALLYHEATWPHIQVERVAVEWQAASGTDNLGSGTAATWLDYDADGTATMVLINASGFAWASIGSGRISLAAGRYFIRAAVPIYDVGRGKIRIYDYTNSAVALAGMSMYGHSAFDDSNVLLSLSGEIVLAATTELRLDYYTTTGAAGNQLGVPVGAGDIERYARIDIEKF